MMRVRQAAPAIGKIAPCPPSSFGAAASQGSDVERKQAVEQKQRKLSSSYQQIVHRLELHALYNTSASKSRFNKTVQEMFFFFHL